MPIATRECETLPTVAKEKSDEAKRLEAAALAVLKRRRAHEAALERDRRDLAAAIVAVFRTGEYKAAEIGRKFGYTPEHVRRLLRAAGIEGDPTRLTPAQRAAQGETDRQQ